MAKNTIESYTLRKQKNPSTSETAPVRNSNTFIAGPLCVAKAATI